MVSLQYVLQNVVIVLYSNASCVVRRIDEIQNTPVAWSILYKNYIKKLYIVTDVFGVSESIGGINDSA